MKERRLSPRATVDVDASYAIVKNPQSYHKATVINIGEHGLCMTCRDKLSVDDQIQITIFIKLKNKIILNARCVWISLDPKSNEYKIGLDIRGSQGSDLDNFLNFYSKQLTKQKK